MNFRHCTDLIPFQQVTYHSALAFPISLLLPELVIIRACKVARVDNPLDLKTAAALVLNASRWWNHARTGRDEAIPRSG